MIYFLLYPMIAVTLGKIQKMEANMQVDHPPQTELSVKFNRLFLIPRFTMGMFANVLVFSAVTYLQPTLALHLRSYDYQPIFIGFSFAIPTLIFATTSPLIHILTKRISKRGTIFLGFVIEGCAFLLVGPSYYLNFSESITITMFGICLLGLGAGMIIIPCLPEMIEATEIRYPGIEMDVLHNKISGIFIAAQGVGETLGPVMGSVFEDLHEFRGSQDIMAFILLSFMVLYFLFCGHVNIFTRTPSKEEHHHTNNDKTLESLLPILSRRTSLDENETGKKSGKA